MKTSIKFFAAIILLIFYTIAKIVLNKIQYVKNDKKPTEKRELRKRHPGAPDN